MEDIIILEESTANPHEVPSSSIVALKSQASNTRDQLRQEEKALEEKVLIKIFTLFCYCDNYFTSLRLFPNFFVIYSSYL